MVASNIASSDWPRRPADREGSRGGDVVRIRELLPTLLSQYVTESPAVTADSAIDSSRLTVAVACAAEAKT